MTKQELQEIREELKKIDLYPWNAYSIFKDEIWGINDCKEESILIDCNKESVEFIAKAPERIEKLLDMADRLHAIIETATEQQLIDAGYKGKIVFNNA